MKLFFQYAIIAAISGITLASCATETVVVRERPVPPAYVTVRPVAPYPGAVWVQEDWAYRGGHYAYVRPHWERPRSGYVWHGGYWENHPHGYAWRRGYWGR